MLRAYEAALQPALDENRDLNEAETTTIGDCRSRMAVIDSQLEHFGTAEQQLTARAQPTSGGVPGNRPGTAVALATQRDRPVITARQQDDFRGADFTRMAIAVAVAGPWNAAAYARMRWGNEEFGDLVNRAVAHWMIRVPIVPPMATDDSLGSNFLVRFDQLQNEFIEMLRPMLIVGRLPSMRRLNFNNAGALLIPRLAGGVSGGYIGEGASIVVNRLAFAQMTLIPSKLAVIVPQTNELLRRSDPPTEQLIRDDMLAGTAQTIDNVFFSLAAPGAGPAGILNGRPENVPGRIPPFDPAGGAANVTAVTEALKRMILALRMENVPMRAPVWIMNTRTREYLRLLRTTQEIFAFKAEIDAGTLLGYPIIDSTAIPIGGWPAAVPPLVGAAANATVYALVDASQLIWADDMGAMIDASQDASVQLDENPATPPLTANPGANFYSAFQNDMVFMRLRMSHTWARRHDVAVVWAFAEE